MNRKSRKNFDDHFSDFWYCICFKYSCFLNEKIIILKSAREKENLLPYLSLTFCLTGFPKECPYQEKGQSDQ